MKPKYEKPVAVPLGEAAKGSGQCNAGSNAALGSSYTADCSQGDLAQYYCTYGSQAGSTCTPGSWTNGGCSGGTSPHKGMYCAAGSWPTGVCTGGTAPANY